MNFIDMFSSSSLFCVSVVVGGGVIVRTIFKKEILAFYEIEIPLEDYKEQ